MALSIRTVGEIVGHSSVCLRRREEANTMGIIQTITATTFVYSVACVAAALAFARLCLSILLHPTRLFWKVKRRDTAPACLTDPVYGIHGYVPIEVKNTYLSLILTFKTLLPSYRLLCGLPTYRRLRGW
jgi:hypothetical protein